MPEPYPNPFSGLAQGLQQGYQMGLLRRQQAQAEAQQIEQEKQKQLDADLKRGTMAMSIMSDKNLPATLRLKAFNEGFTTVWNKLNPDSNISPLDAWPENGSEYAKRALAIWKNPDYDMGTKRSALAELLVEAQSTGEKLDLSAMTDIAKEEVQVGRKPSKQIERTVDLGDKVEYIYTDGTRETKDKGVSPNVGMGAGSVVIVPTAEGLARVNKVTGQVDPLGVGKPLTGEMITTEQQIGTVKDVFERVKNLYNESFVGPAQGRLGSIKSLTVGNSPEQAQFISDLQDLNNTLVYLKSGKQINEQEYARLKAAMPHLNLADSDFKARMGAFEKTLNSIVTERRKNMGGYGKNGGGQANKSKSKFQIIEVK